MKTLSRRTPFFGMPEDAALLGDPTPARALPEGWEMSVYATAPVPYAPPKPKALGELVACMGDGTAPDQPTHLIPGADPSPVHPLAQGEIGTIIALGFVPHRGENRTQRLAGVANWEPPTKDDPLRRELLKQRQRQRRGKLDPELRRLQRERLKQK